MNKQYMEYQRYEVHCIQPHTFAKICTVASLRTESTCKFLYCSCSSTVFPIWHEQGGGGSVRSFLVVLTQFWT